LPRESRSRVASSWRTVWSRVSDVDGMSRNQTAFVYTDTASIPEEPRDIFDTLETAVPCSLESPLRAFFHRGERTAAAAATARSASIPFELRRPLHVNAESAAYRGSDLVDASCEPLAAHIQTLTEKLGVSVTTRPSSARTLLTDRRRGCRGVLAAMAHRQRPRSRRCSSIPATIDHHSWRSDPARGHAERRREAADRPRGKAGPPQVRRSPRSRAR